MITVASRKKYTSTREVQRLAAIVRRMAKAAFMHSSQRKGSCTKRNLGKCCQSRLLRENISRAVTAPQAESGNQRTWSGDAAMRLILDRRESQIARARAPISASAMVETRRLKRL